MRSPEYEVRLLRAAETDLADIVAYVSIERPKAASGLLTRIESALGRLAHTPYIGRLPNDDHLVELGYRCLIFEDYLAFYTVEERTVFVHRILHGARDYSALF